MESISFIDELPRDPEEAVAVKYMWRALDDQIAHAESGWQTGAPPPGLDTLIQLRYGELPNVEKRRGQTTIDTIKTAVARTRPPVLEGIAGYVLRWSEARELASVRWFQQHLKDLWPKEIAFLAEDLPTLYAACAAMDIAPIRAKPVADDPFPAPPILITGPTGTGKELLAKAIHLRSGREPSPWRPNKLQQFGALNCGGLPTELLESELFGHVKGAFTGAVKDKPGFVKQYGSGTLFLDEIGDMPPEVQVRLLRFLNDGEFRPVGSNAPERSTPRIISATHVHLEAKVAEKAFREDLFFRIRGRRIRLMGLKDRPRRSVRALISRFLAEEAMRRDRPTPTLTSQAWTALTSHDWPGNMRELRYVVERLLDEAVSGRVLDLDQMDPEVARRYREVVPLPEQHVLGALAERERGDETKGRFLLFLGLSFRYKEQEQKPDTRAATMRRAAQLVDRISRNVGLQEQLSIHVKALELASRTTLIQEFREKWIDHTRQSAKQVNFDAEQSVGLFESILDKQADNANVELAELRSQAKQVSNAYAISGIAANLVRLAETGAIPQAAKMIEALEVMADMSQAPPLSDGLRWVVDKVRDFTPEELENKLDSLLKKAQAGDGGQEQPLTWNDVKDNPELLEAIIQQCGSVAKAAQSLDVRSETVSRARSKGLGDGEKAARKRRAGTKKS